MARAAPVGEPASPPEAPLPNALPRPAGELEALEQVWAQPRGWRSPTAVNNIYIGKLYIGTALLFLLLAGVLALVMRAQLAVPGATLVTPGTYNQLFTMHGTVMMFLFAVPIVEAVAVYLLPNMLGARDLPFPRLSAYAFWAYAIGGLTFFCTIFVGLAPDGGWFMYPPLTSRVYSPGLNADFWLLGIGFIEISAIAGAIELIIGILMTRAPGMSLSRMPVYAWSMLIVGFMIVFAFPAIIAGTALLEIERAFDWPLFDPTRGGDPLLWQHLFWFFGHPEVYIIFLPAAGMVSSMLPALVGKPLAGHRAIVAALFAVGFFSFALWAHHMFTAGLGSLSMSLVSVASMLVAVPAGIQVFAWIATLWRGRVRANGPTLFLLGFLVTFVMGGLTGVMVAVLPFDWQAHDSYFIVAHLHYVLIGGMVFPVFAALYYWLPLLNGHRLSERWARWVFALVFGGFHLTFFPMHIAGLLGMPRRVYTYDAGLGWEWPNLLSSQVFGGFHLTFFPMHIAGLLGMPRRVYTYDAGLGWEWPNLLSSLGAAVLAAGVLLLSVDVIRTTRRPARAHGNPWSAPTLEWIPSGNYATRSIAQISTRWPLWQQPGLSEQVVAGQHWLPGTALGLRETLVTGARRADIRHLIVLPGPSWWPVLGALGTAGFFMLLTIKWVMTAFAFGAVAVFSVVAWMWQADRLALNTPVSATIGRGVDVPVGAALWASHSWWATVILLIVDFTVLASMAFTHIHLSMRLDVCPPPGAALPSLASMLGVAGCFVLSPVLYGLAGRGIGRRSLTRWRLLLLGVALATAYAGTWLLIGGMTAAGLAPKTTGWAASIAVLLGYQGFHLAILVVMGAFLAARIWVGWPGPRQRATYDNTGLMWCGSCLQGVVVALLPHGMVWVMS